MSYRAVMIDLDGTLLQTDGQVSARNRRALTELMERGVEVMIATGRGVPSALSATRDLGLSCPLVCFNGSVIVEPGGKLLQELKLCEQIAEAVIDAVVHAGIDLLAHRGDRKQIVPPGRHHELEGILARMIHVEHIDAHHPGDLTRIGLVADGGPLERLLSELRAAHAIDSYHYPLSHIPSFADFSAHHADIEPASAGKAEGLAWLQANRGIDPAEVVAIGDMHNDLPMLRAAGLGVAMGTAPQPVREAADRTTAHHDEDGVAQVLESVFCL